MKSRRLAAVLATSALVAPLSLALAAPTQAAAAGPRVFANCTAMNKVHPHGVGRPGAVDKTSSTKVTTFTRNAKLYRANAKSDRDKDGIACEKK
ncbi:excalibur calcium-binding domain-containing protein [Nocardioides albidus]|uniref:Excalibur calcium-binding domain-containing protein n=1 Tax=Nocardioides albidus TaxID=1517589 RepID=A0A5C4VUL1_9ACTN|nr:excalibur calcium-binding domain-containing protein [Nocardioides albidus]TNM39481.1 excalibur calcium-binding domain-containing protein [Nocardioides albidus]